MFLIADDVVSNTDHDVRISFAVDVSWMQVNRLQQAHQCMLHLEC